MTCQECKPGSFDRPLTTRHDSHCEANSVVYIAEDFVFVLEVVEGIETLGAQRVSEEGSGGLVGGEAGWGEDAGSAGRAGTARMVSAKTL